MMLDGFVESEARAIVSKTTVIDFRNPQAVMAGLDPAIHEESQSRCRPETWTPGSSPGVTVFGQTQG